LEQIHLTYLVHGHAICLKSKLFGAKVFNVHTINNKLHVIYFKLQTNMPF